MNPNTKPCIQTLIFKQYINDVVISNDGVDFNFSTMAEWKKQEKEKKSDILEENLMIYFC